MLTLLSVFSIDPDVNIWKAVALGISGAIIFGFLFILAAAHDGGSSESDDD